MTLGANIDGIAVGIACIYQYSVTNITASLNLPYFSLSLALNVILTLMIAVRLVLHARNTRAAMGLAGIGGLCNAVIIMFIESCALYSVSLVLIIGPLVAGHPIVNFFLFIQPQTQVRSPSLPRSSDCFFYMRVD